MLADLNSKDSKIYLDDKFFKLKGSNKGERRDALLQHEIGHQNLHNINSDNKTVDKDKRDMKVYKNIVKNAHKDGLMRQDIAKDSPYMSKEDNHISRKIINDKDGAAARYASTITKDKEESKQRRVDQAIAKKYEKSNPHANAEEYEADRFAANKTSEKALKKDYKIIINL